MKQGFEAQDKAIKQTFDLHEKIASARYESVVNRIDHLASVFTTNHDALVKALDMDRRMERLESGASSKPRNAAPRRAPGKGKESRTA